MRDPEWRPELGIERPETVKALIRQLAEAEMTGGNVGALGVAAIARYHRRPAPRGTAAHRLQGGLPLAVRRTFAEPLGEGVTLHELVRKALRPTCACATRSGSASSGRRIADYFWSRASAGDLLLSIDLAHLCEQPADPLGLLVGGLDPPPHRRRAPGDLDPSGLCWTAASTPTGSRSRRFFHESADRVAIARDTGDELAGFQVSVTPTNGAAVRPHDPLLGPWLAHARDDARRQRGAVARLDRLHRQAELRVQAMLGMAGCCGRDSTARATRTCRSRRG